MQDKEKKYFPGGGTKPDDWKKVGKKPAIPPHKEPVKDKKKN